MDEHRRRAEGRRLDIPGLRNPPWDEIVNREYAAWNRDRLVVDTAVLSVDESVALICASLAAT